jgi:hypothetical protein
MNGLPELEAFVLAVAPAHYPTRSAPSTWPELKEAARSGNTNPLPVFDGGCERTIYTRPAVNHAFRAWHDTLHLTLWAGFSHGGELAVARAHYDACRRAGLPDASAALIGFDTWGQYRYFETTGEFLDDQREFVTRCGRAFPFVPSSWRQVCDAIEAALRA